MAISNIPNDGQLHRDVQTRPEDKLHMDAIKISVDQNGDNTKAKLHCTIGGIPRVVSHKFAGKISDTEAQNYMLLLAESRLGEDVQKREDHPLKAGGHRDTAPRERHYLKRLPEPASDMKRSTESRKTLPEEAVSDAKTHGEAIQREKIIKEIDDSETTFVKNMKNSQGLVLELSTLNVERLNKLDKSQAEINDDNDFFASMSLAFEKVADHSLVTTGAGSELNVNKLLDYLQGDDFKVYCEGIKEITLNYDRISEACSHFKASDYSADYKINKTPEEAFVTAVQRLPRLELFLKDYLKKGELDAETSHRISDALHLIQAILVDINTTKRIDEHTNSLIELCKHSGHHMKNKDLEKLIVGIPLDEITPLLHKLDLEILSLEGSRRHSKEMKIQDNLKALHQLLEQIKSS